MKRTLSICLVLILLCAAVPASADRADDAESLRAFLQSHYGVTVLMGDECAAYPPETFEIQIIPEGDTAFQRMTAGNGRFTDLLRRLDDVFSVYPPEFFSRFAKRFYFTGLRFLLTDQIIRDETRVGGVQAVHDEYIDIYLAKDDVGERGIHHEIWHAMDYRIRCDDPHAFDGWADLNPAGFRYTGDFDAVHDGKEQDEPEDWFTGAYGRIDEYEDRATVFEAVMLKNEAWWSIRPHLRKKAEYLLEKARPVFGEIFAGE